MKAKRTMRDIKSQYPTIIQVSYCDAQNYVSRAFARARHLFYIVCNIFCVGLPYPKKLRSARNI